MIELQEPNISKEYISIQEYFQAPKQGGLYFFYDSNYELMYIGKSKDLQYRIKSHMGNGATIASKDIRHNFTYFKFSVIDCVVDREIYETYLINKFKPKLNRDKVFLYKTSFYEEQYNPKYIIEQNVIWNQHDKAMDDFSL